MYKDHSITPLSMQTHAPSDKSLQFTPLATRCQLDLQRLNRKLYLTFPNHLMAQLPNRLPVRRLISILLQSIKDTCLISTSSAQYFHQGTEDSPLHPASSPPSTHNGSTG